MPYFHVLKHLFHYWSVLIWQAWNAQTTTDLNLDGPVGQVYALVVGNDLLFAGTQVYCYN